MYKLIFYTRYCNRFVLYMQWVCFISIDIDLASVQPETKSSKGTAVRLAAQAGCKGKKKKKS